MNYYKFWSANILGAFLWGCGITLAGYFAGSIPWVKNLSYLLAILLILGFFYTISQNKNIT
jgi:membrane-associated protein